MRFWLFLVFSLSCGPVEPAGTDAGSGSPVSGEASTGNDAGSGNTMDMSSTTTNATSTSGEGMTWMNDYGPCAMGQECPNMGVCVELDGASICGPGCYEKGPGAFRCPESEIQDQTSCPWLTQDGMLVTAPCLISCTDAMDCPASGMVCVPCPDQFAADCPLGSGSGLGPNMCAWPNP